MKKPTDQTTINISETEYQALIERVQLSSLAEQDRQWIVSILQTFRFLQGELKHNQVALHKIKELCFGKKTEKDPSEKTKNKSLQARSLNSIDEVGGPSEETKNGILAEGDEKLVDKNLPLTSDVSKNLPQTKEDQILDLLDPPNQDEGKRTPGHGRRPSDGWPNAKRVNHCHTGLKVGQICPECKEGKLYPYEKPSVFARIVGNTPLEIEVHQCDRLRCGLCGALFTAPLPKDVQNFPVATPEANAVAAITKYQAATPFNRFAQVLKAYGTPLPRSRLYDMAAELAEIALPIFGELCRFAAQGELFQNDDTKVIVQSLLQENQEAYKRGAPLERKGMFTTGIISQIGAHRVALYFTGRKHAGENLAAILQKRIQGLPPPTQVSDRLSANVPKGYQVDDGACLDHLRREFYGIRKSFQVSCRYILRELKIVYRADFIAKRKGMTAAERLKLHQEVSLPVMERIKEWGKKELEEKKVEPNGFLGRAINYLINHYVALTLFTRKEGVPIANSSCEQILKTPISIRKMAYFFRTVESAEVASIFFSLIQTCGYIEENTFNYFVAIQKNATDVRMNPSQWLPWNYRERLKILNQNLQNAV